MGCLPPATVVAFEQVPTKESKRNARRLVEDLELRVHTGPPVGAAEIQSARDFLRQNDFPSASDYFSRLGRVQDRLVTRPVSAPRQKRNYGGEAAGCWMQVLSVYDHVIVSTCHDGEFNARRGRVKISHRFNEAGRVDFVELKLLRSLQPGLDGAFRKLVTIQDFQGRPKDWWEADAFALRVLPQELVFLFRDIFRCSRSEVLAWLVNIGHRLAADLVKDLEARTVNGAERCGEGQLELKTLPADGVAMPILRAAAALESAVELAGDDEAVVRYIRKPALVPIPLQGQLIRNAVAPAHSPAPVLA